MGSPPTVFETVASTIPPPRLGEKKMERLGGFEPPTLSLARRCSTTEPQPLVEVSAGTLVGGAEGQSRTADTGIFSAVLYHLSYLGLPSYRSWRGKTCQGELRWGQPMVMWRPFALLTLGGRIILSGLGILRPCPQNLSRTNKRPFTCLRRAEERCGLIRHQSASIYRLLGASASSRSTSSMGGPVAPGSTSPGVPKAW